MTENREEISVETGGEWPALGCSLGVMAYNEEKNVAQFLDRVAQQRLSTVGISEIIVVASGCTDGTEREVLRCAEKDSRIRLVSEPERRGKAAAVNVFLSEAKEEILVVAGADTLPDSGAVENLVSPLADPAVGMAGARPVPLNSKDTFTGYVVHFLWELHHQLATRMPKCGEMVAFRKVFDQLPGDTVVDEPQVEALVRGAGLDVVYVPDAIVYNLGPSTLSEIIMRRSSIIAGYMRLAKRTRYRVSTQRLRWWLVGYVAARVLRGEEPFFRASGAVAVELISRAAGSWQARFSKKPLHLWPAAESTKAPSSEIPTK